jgi:hypothetical protein
MHLNVVSLHTPLMIEYATYHNWNQTTSIARYRSKKLFTHPIWPMWLDDYRMYIISLQKHLTLRNLVTDKHRVFML